MRVFTTSRLGGDLLVFTWKIWLRYSRERASQSLPKKFFRRDALKEQFGKEPSTVKCLAVKSALLGTRHPRKEKETALQTVTAKPACLDGKILMSTQSEKEPSVKICKKEVRSSQPAGSPIHRASQGLLPELPPKRDWLLKKYFRKYLRKFDKISSNSEQNQWKPFENGQI